MNLDIAIIAYRVDEMISIALQGGDGSLGGKLITRNEAYEVCRHEISKLAMESYKALDEYLLGLEKELASKVDDNK